MNPRIKNRKKRHNGLRARDKPDRIKLIKEAKARLNTKKFALNRMAVNKKFGRSAEEKPTPPLISSPKKVTAKKRAERGQKKLNRGLDLKHYEGSLADKLLDLVSERKKDNLKLITGLLDRIWRKSMNGGILNGKDFEAIEAAKSFLREVDSHIS